MLRYEFTKRSWDGIVPPGLSQLDRWWNEAEFDLRRNYAPSTHRLLRSGTGLCDGRRYARIVTPDPDGRPQKGATKLTLS